jgi:hypothetical protein
MINNGVNIIVIRAKRGKRPGIFNPPPLFFSFSTYLKYRTRLIMSVINDGHDCTNKNKIFVPVCVDLHSLHPIWDNNSTGNKQVDIYISTTFY